MKAEEFNEWLLHPVTRAMKEQFREDLERLKGDWLAGRLAKDKELDAYVRGQCVILQQFIDLEPSDLEGES